MLEYRNRALPIIEGLLKSDKLPVVVGGTNYYIESILWKILVQNPDEKVLSLSELLRNNYHELPSSELHEQLKILDPAMARRLHPNNKRKILRFVLDFDLIGVILFLCSFLLQVFGDSTSTGEETQRNN